MKTDDFDYYLPEALIAQTPLAKRDNSRLMILDRKTGEIKHEVFYNIVNYLTKYLSETQKSGRGSYTIGIACSGGQHRSTYVANYLANYFSKEYRTSVVHRDSPNLNKE